MQEIDREQYLSVDEAIALLGVKKATLYAYVSRGLLPSFRQGVGRQRLYRRADIERLLAVRSDMPTAQAPAEASAPLPTADDDRTQRNVDLPPSESWVGDH
jgi:excisionase family DNA binding protein